MLIVHRYFTWTGSTQYGKSQHYRCINMVLLLRHPQNVIFVLYCSKFIVDLGETLMFAMLLLLNQHIFAWLVKSFYKTELLIKMLLFNYK